MERYDDYRTLLKDPGVDAVRAVKHVVAEKPLAATLQQGRRVLQTDSESQVLVCVAENFRYRRPIVQAGWRKDLSIPRGLCSTQVSTQWLH